VELKVAGSRKPIIITLPIVADCMGSGSGGEGDTPEPSRPCDFGFTPFPCDIGPEAVDGAYARIADDSDI
jgi:hypothetical protein